MVCAWSVGVSVKIQYKVYLNLLHRWNLCATWPSTNPEHAFITWSAYQPKWFLCNTFEALLGIVSVYDREKNKEAALLVQSSGYKNTATASTGRSLAQLILNLKKKQKNHTILYKVI